MPVRFGPYRAVPDWILVVVWLFSNFAKVSNAWLALQDILIHNVNINGRLGLSIGDISIDGQVSAI